MVCVDWPDRPAGVKFDPSDVELLEHFAAKSGVGRAKKDGTSVHFFYRITNAYASGQRKRRRIQNQENVINVHKTGITKADENVGVSKIFYQPHKDKLTEECNIATAQLIPNAPFTTDSYPPRLENYFSTDYFTQLFLQGKEYSKEPPHHRSFDSGTNNEIGYATSLDENSEVADLSRADSLLCDKIIHSYTNLDDLKPNIPSLTQAGFDVSSSYQKYGNASHDISDLNNLLLDTLPDF
ncbi:NAC domain containing protein 85 [Striga asiatica]|uniref:NAC domain containing protein 85 n=1 Tax=Striga asiatica TaxID=4170 RepID=A0A5A7Q7Y2_STRAF|nr:NAC domain containing protein 85 [Striga asiatica]